mgnify:CR=1 FL=1
MEQDLNKIAQIEKAIKEKYGSEAIQNPKGNWTKEKEKKYLKDLEKFYQRNKRKATIEQHECFIQYVEDREERWKSGWRPNN